MSEILDFQGISETLNNMSQQILPDLLPGGKLVGKEWQCGNIYGQSGASFKYNIEKNTFSDFADNSVSGKGIAALYQKQKGITWGESCRELSSRYIGDARPLIKYNYPVKKYVEKQEIIKPPLDVDNPPIPNNTDSWCYRDAKGDPLYYIVKGVDERTGKKFFYPLVFTTKKEWVKKQYPEQTLYGLDHLAKDLTKPVLIVEGEKCKDAAFDVMKAYIPVTWAGGAQAWKKTDWSVLRGRKVLIWPDNDQPGIDAANGIAAHLLASSFAAEVKIINVNQSDKPEKWDCFDAFKTDGWVYKDFAAWAKPITTSHVARKPVEIVEEQEELASASVAVEDLDNLIPIQDFPVSPNLQMRFIDLGMQFSDSKQTKLVMNASNVAKIIRSDFPGIVWRDTFYGKVFTKWKSGVERQWSDNDTNNLFIEMQHHYGLAKISKSNVEDAISFVASLNEKNEPQEWLKTLIWDGTNRLETFFNVAMGAKDSAYTTAVSRNFWISLVARIMQPGCKADEMVILEGKQGTYKTTSLELIGGKWYGEVNCDISSKDFDQGLRGKILVEFGELANLKGADVETIKRKLSTRVDEYRPSYGRYVEQHPRTCIFAGTTNSDQYLKDPTGNRRFLPMKIVRVDTEYIKKNREQLFAEALSRFNSGEQWHEIPWGEAEEIRSDRMVFDEWENQIVKILSEGIFLTSHFTSTDIFVAMGNEAGKFNFKSDGGRISNIMSKLGYEKKSLRTNGLAMKVWVKTCGN